MRPLAALILAALLIPSSFAHLAGGDDLVIDGLIADFGYEPSPPVRGEQVTLAFGLTDEASGLPIAPEAVWVRIVKDGKVIYAGTHKAEEGQVALAYTFADGGKYQVTARYTGGEYTLAEATFELDVQGADSRAFIIALVAGIASIILAVIGYRFVSKK